MAIFQVEQTHFPAVLIVHCHGLRNCFTYLLKEGVVFYNFDSAVITKEFIVVHRQNFHLWISSQLLEHIFERTAAEIELISIQQMKAEWPAFGLISIGRQEAENLCLIQKLIDFFYVRHCEMLLSCRALRVVPSYNRMERRTSFSRMSGFRETGKFVERRQITVRTRSQMPGCWMESAEGGIRSKNKLH